MAENNQTILASVYLNATNDYQQRIPDPTQTSIAATMDALFDPMNKSYYNQFIDILVNRIAMTYVRGKVWDNVLAPFKGAKVNYGSTIQEVAPKWIRAHSYDDEAETLLKLHRPEAQAWYHSQNRRDQYAITINHEELRTAFTDEFGLNNLISQIMTVPMTSDNYDEYRIMLQLLAEYDSRWGFFKHKLSAIPSDDVTGKELLKAIRTYAGKLQFPSTVYNAQDITDIPVFAKKDELVLFVTPETQATLDVDTLAAVFNLDKADIQQRTVIVDEFPMPNCAAILTTEDFFVCNDTVYENTSFWNPQRMDTTYYLNHWGIYSVSPFVPAIMFTTDDATVVPVITQEVTGIEISAAFDNAEAGSDVPLTVKLVGAVTKNGDDIVVAPDAATYELSATIPDAENDSEVLPYNLTAVTRVDNYGVLHISKEVPSGAVITINATSTYTNPSGTTERYTASTTVTVQ